MVALLIIIAPAVVRSWRNRQTRTFEGRMGDRMGSSPIDRTRKETAFVYQTKAVSFQRNKSLAGFVKCLTGVKYG